MTTSSLTAVRKDVREWAGLVRTGAVGSLASVMLVVVQVVAYVVWPPPSTTRGFFELLVEHPVRGLVALDLLYLVSNLAVYLLYLALAVVLWRVSRSAVVVALAFGVLGMAAYLASPRPVEMLTLARSFAEAGPAEQVSLLATGDGMLATWTGTAFDAYYLLNLVTLAVLALLMYRSDAFSRGTARWGLAAALLMAVPSTFGTVGLVLALASLAPWCVFATLVGLRLWALADQARPGSQTLPRSKQG